MALCQKQDKTSAPWIFPFCNIPTITFKNFQNIIDDGGVWIVFGF